MKELKAQFQKGLSKAEAQQLGQLVEQNEEIFEQVMQLFLEGPSRSSQIAAGVISACVARKPSLLHPYLPAMLNQLEDPAVKDASKRNTLRILQFVPIPEAYEGKLMAFCFEYLAAPSKRSGSHKSLFHDHFTPAVSKISGPPK